jgi:hypothetical protein
MRFEKRNARREVSSGRPLRPEQPVQAIPQDSQNLGPRIKKKTFYEGLLRNDAGIIKEKMALAKERQKNGGKANLLLDPKKFD